VIRDAIGDNIILLLDQFIGLGSGLAKEMLRFPWFSLITVITKEKECDDSYVRVLMTGIPCKCSIIN
jgi:hypothetical protein